MHCLVLFTPFDDFISHIIVSRSVVEVQPQHGDLARLHNA